MPGRTGCFLRRRFSAFLSILSTNWLLPAACIYHIMVVTKGGCGMCETVKCKVISSLEKCFYDDDMDQFPELRSISMLRNEKLSFQLAVRDTDESLDKRLLSLHIEGELREYIAVRQTVCVPCAQPTAGKNYDSHYLRVAPGLYPDLITDLGYHGRLPMTGQNLRTFWLDVALPDGFAAGTYHTTLTLKNGEEAVAAAAVDITVVAGDLPVCPIPHTEWFYVDCLADYYDVPVFSEKHWAYIENFARTACENGINTLFTPVITPALDTYIGGERTTTQLVGITVRDGRYEFDFSRLDRWIDMGKRIGIRYYEIPPFYTQWGANAAPKVVAAVDGVEQRIFGWDTDSRSAEYTAFLDALIPALTAQLKLRGVDRQTFFHISDEPDRSQFAHYRAVADHVRKHLTGYTVIDAVSHLEAFQEGILDTPVVIVSGMKEFLDAGADRAWIYYCCVPTTVYTNRFIAMPAARTRILGVQMYKYDIKGFLHWGYNFYNCQYSYNTVNPYLDTTGDYFAPSGDAYVVYPGKGGVPEPSIRLKLLRDAFQDIRALQLCEQLYDRDYVIGLIDEGLDTPLTLSEYPQDAAYILALREKVNGAIRERIGSRG